MVDIRSISGRVLRPLRHQIYEAARHHVGLIHPSSDDIINTLDPTQPSYSASFPFTIGKNVRGLRTEAGLVHAADTTEG